MNEASYRAYKKRRAAQKAAENAQLSQAEDVPAALNNSISSNIVFDEGDRYTEQVKVQQKSCREGERSVQDMSFLIDTQKSIAKDIKRRLRMEKANEAAITRLIKEDAIQQMSIEEASSASMTKLIQEEEVFHSSVNFNESSSSLFCHAPDPTSSDAELKRSGAADDDRKKAKKLYELVCSDTEPNEAGVVDPSKWDCVRNFMLTYPELMQRAARVRDCMGITPLHQVCRRQPPVNVIELFVSCCGLEALSTTDKLKRLPIHYACRHNASVEVIKALVNLHPECRTKQDIEGGTPLHHAIANKEAPVGMVDGVCSEQAASTADRWGMMPLHHALTREFSKTQSIKVLMTAHPPGLAHLDLKGRAPIHWLVKCCYMDASIELLELAFALDPALGKGDMGLHLLRLLNTCAETNIKSPNVQACCNMLLQLNPDPTDSFSKVLKTLPRWLNRGGVTKRRPPFFKRSLMSKSK